MTDPERAGDQGDTEHGGTMAVVASPVADHASSENETPLPNEIAEFLTHLTKERDLSPNTVSAYSRDLREFSGWLGSTHGIAGWDWNALGRADIRGFMAQEVRHGLER